MQPYNLGAETHMQGEILEGVLDRQDRKKKSPAHLRVCLLWATCIAWAAQKAAKMVQKL